MTTITIERELLDQVLAVLTKSSCAIGYESETEWLNVNSKIRAALAAPESGAMAEIDYTDDDALRFIQRVLESDAPGADKKAARDMVVEIRTRVLKARASKPATAPEKCGHCGRRTIDPPWPVRTATAPDLSDAYAGAREDLKIWKKRALEAEETVRQLNRALAEEVDGPTFMGEPVLPATAPEPTTDVAVKRLSKALRDDLDYAWAWHCNIAMSAYDAGCPHDVANEGAARFMQLLAGVDTRKHPGFAGTQPNGADDRHAQELLAQDITIANMRERHAQELCAYEVTVDKLRAERKPMTDEEIVDAIPDSDVEKTIYEWVVFIVRAVEAHHGIGDKT